MIRNILKPGITWPWSWTPRAAKMKPSRHYGVIQLAPKHVPGFANLFALLYEVHRYSDAEAVARQALTSHSHSFRSNYMRGTVLIQQNKWSDEAKAKLEYAQTKIPRRTRQA